MNVRQWFRTWWLRIPDPRDISLAYTVIYVIAGATGLVTLVYPPTTIKAAIGPAAMAGIGVLLLVGAVLGMLGGAWEHWKLERVGIGLMGSALVIYGILVAVLHFQSPGSRLTQLGVIVLAVGVFAVRYLMIRRYTFRPRG
ncbi:hypothetical protein [Leucobacter sp.]